MGKPRLTSLLLRLMLDWILVLSRSIPITSIPCVCRWQRERLTQQHNWQLDKWEGEVFKPFSETQRISWISRIANIKHINHIKQQRPNVTKIKRVVASSHWLHSGWFYCRGRSCRNIWSRQSSLVWDNHLSNKRLYILKKAFVSSGPFLPKSTAKVIL